jgi:3-hydroxyisobutyrate dehydrogenase
MKAFLGMGLLGSGFVRALLQRGEQVQVWNRTHSKATALEQYGAKAFTDVKEAVRGATHIHITLKDDATVDDVLAAAGSALVPGAVIIDHTTTSQAGAVKRTAYWKEQGFTYQHAPVFMGPANALERTGFILVSGDQSVIQQLEPQLATMTGKVMNFGNEAGKAAAIKLAGNAFLVCLTTGLRETLIVSKSMGVSVSELNTLFDSWNPGTQVHARLKRITAADHTQPSWELAMARKDTGLFIDAAAQSDTPLTLLPAIASLMDEWIRNGYGNHDWTVMGKDLG